MPRLLLFALLLVGLLQNAVLAQVAQNYSRAASLKARRLSPRKRTPKTRAVDPTVGDNLDGEDLVIRRAAVEALGNQAGTVVVADPTTGRILSIVNQKLAFSTGFTPCSTIKLVTALAALNEHVVDKDTFIYLGRYLSYNMTTALARSNNQYFANLGTRLGFDRVIHYAQMLGLGEKAGLDISGEQPGVVADAPPKAGGMGLLTAFGEGFQVTPLELTAIVSAIANGGTLYYLQYPHSEDEAEHLTPQVKRPLELSASIDDIKMGLRGAVDYGTARRASDPNETIFGKTGTCTDFRAGSHMGWIGSFAQAGSRSLVVVVMLTSPVKSVSGAVASGVAGAFYHNLDAQNYFVANADSPKKSGLPEIITTTPAPPATPTSASNSGGSK